jgi:hypothetical protein
MRIEPVADEQWTIVAWLRQAFRHDLALIVNGLPYADGRYQAAVRSIAAFRVPPAVRGQGVGGALAIEVLRRHAGPWSIGFQHDNHAAGAFWRGVADTVFGPGNWSEIQRAVPGLPDVPPDHFIDSLR